jgi:lysophospholipase L1-like esterase
LRDSGLADYGGESGISRFKRDALDQPGVRYVLLLEGTNDIAVGPLDGDKPPHPASAADVIAGLTNLARQAHARSVKIYASTLLPFEVSRVAGFYSVEKNEVRQQVNNWIRTSREIDGYLEFDGALRDPGHPNRIEESLTDDSLHPNSLGHHALSDAVDLSLFQ